MALNHSLILPRWIKGSAWIKHIPIADYLVKTQKPGCIVELGTHHGVSCFAFAQSAREANVDCSIFAVDLWSGDEHSGQYSEQVYVDVLKHASEEYRDIVYLLRADFNEAVNYFLDGQINLLHIDGLHTYGAVKNDFETWLPKLNQDGIMLFHDTNVREKDFGVFRLLDEICNDERFRVYELKTGYGLGIVCYKTSDKACALVDQIDENVLLFRSLGRLYSSLFDCKLLSESLLRDQDNFLGQIDILGNQVRSCKAAYEASFFWKMTKPLRRLGDLLRLSKRRALGS
jgi:predicted O-methyltransferase YrrM